MKTFRTFFSKKTTIPITVFSQGNGSTLLCTKTRLNVGSNIHERNKTKKKDKLLKTNRKKLIDQGLGRSTVDVNLKKKNQ